MKLSIIGLITLGLVAAFSAALLMAAMGRAPVALGSGDDSEVTVLVAMRDIPSVTIVTADDFEERTIAREDAPAGHLSNSLQVVGKTTTRKIVEGQALSADCFATNRRGIDLVANLPAGKRAVTVELKLSSGLEGLLYPGSVVDVLASFEIRSNESAMRGMALSTTLLKGVEVLAIDEETITEPEDSDTKAEDDRGSLTQRKSRRVTLLVDSKQAEALQLASEHGVISLAMRNPHDEKNTDQDATLLHGGQLASLAEYLGASVSEDGMGGMTLASEDGPSSLHRGNKKMKWDITVMRGTEVDVQTFEEDGGGTMLAVDEK